MTRVRFEPGQKPEGFDLWVKSAADMRAAGSSWEEVLQFLRDSGASQIHSVMVMWEQGVSLMEADRTVIHSVVWADKFEEAKKARNEFWDAVEQWATDDPAATVHTEGDQIWLEVDLRARFGLRKGHQESDDSITR